MPVGNYLNGDDCNNNLDEGSNSRHDITAFDRMQIVNWCYQIIDRCQFNRETVVVAMNLVDRFMSTSNSSLSDLQDDILSNCGKYQLLIANALFTSIKLNERLSFSSQDFATAVCQGTYSLREVEAMELLLLHGLQWRMSPPTSLRVGYEILSLLFLSQEAEKTFMAIQTRASLREELASQTEIIVREYHLAIMRPSTIAFAAIMNDIEQNPSWRYCFSRAA